MYIIKYTQINWKPWGKGQISNYDNLANSDGMAQSVKNLPAMQETWVWSLGWEDPLEKEMATHSGILAWRIPWTEKPGGLRSMGLKRAGHDWGLECKSRKSRDTCSNRQVWPWWKKWSNAKANTVLLRKRTGHSKCSLPTTQETTVYMDITRWSIPKSDRFYSLQPKMEKLYTVSKNKTGSWLWLRSWTPYCQIQT